MPAKGMGPVRSRLKAVFEEIAGPMTEACLIEVMVIGGGHADSLTPVDLGTLINSRYRKVEKTANGWTGKYGYTAAYAAAVHGFSGKLKGQPREHFGMTSNRSEVGPKQSKAFGGGSGSGKYWDNGTGGGEPQWLTKGFEREGIAEIKEAIIRNMTL